MDILTAGTNFISSILQVAFLLPISICDENEFNDMA